jgi:hypothetical protein
MTTRDIRAHLREMYDVEVSPDLISRVTDAVVEELAEWQARPLDRLPGDLHRRADGEDPGSVADHVAWRLGSAAGVT